MCDYLACKLDVCDLFYKTCHLEYGNYWFDSCQEADLGKDTGETSPPKKKLHFFVILDFAKL